MSPGRVSIRPPSALATFSSTMSAAVPYPDRPLLLLDYDGTLAPIVDDPAKATPHPEVPDLLSALAERYPLVVITGRDLETLHRLLDVRVRAVGLHGVEHGRLGGRIERPSLSEHAGTLARLRETVPELPGVVVEDKGHAFAVHYRHASDPDAARDALERWAETAPDTLAAIFGKLVVELRPQGISKGTAVTRLAAEYPACTPVYLGDDVTDEDAFAALNDLTEGRQGVTVKIGEGETQADYRLEHPQAVLRYLQGYLNR